MENSGQTAGARPQAAPPDRREAYRTGALISLLRLHWFIRFRWGIICAAFAVLLAEHLMVPGAQRPIQLIIVLLVLAGANLAWTVVSRSLFSKIEDSEAFDEEGVIRSALFFANMQVAFDLLLLTVILRYTGGVANPMAVFYLFHMAICSLVLRGWQAIVQGVWAVFLYALMGIGELGGWLTPHYALLPTMGDLHLHTLPEYVAAAIAIVACGVFGMLYFTLRIAGRLDERERQLRQVLDALQRSQAAITDLQQRRSRFMQTAAHQLKTPLAVIQTFAGLIRDEVVQGEAVRDTCKKIMYRCQEGINQVTELLTLARLQQADPAQRPGGSSDVREVVEELCRRYGPLAENKKIELRCIVSEGADLRAEVGLTDLTDCIGNLIDNAIKYTFGPGRVTVTAARTASTDLSGRITLTDPPARPGEAGTRAPDDARLDDRYVAVTVTDTGMGIDPAVLAPREGAQSTGSIFDAFRRGNSALAAGIPGTGLGLSIVLEVVEQAGGRVHVRSQPGKGSSFTVFLPARNPNRSAETLSVRNTRVSHVVIEEDSDAAPSDGGAAASGGEVPTAETAATGSRGAD